jgi:hypothetical protein
MANGRDADVKALASNIRKRRMAKEVGEMAERGERATEAGVPRPTAMAARLAERIAELEARVARPAARYAGGDRAYATKLARTRRLQLARARRAAARGPQR